MWWKQANVYHVFPLGLCGCEVRNFLSEPGENKFPLLGTQAFSSRSWGANTLLLGPVFQSETHGYDTRDFFQVDYRLGSTEDFFEFLKEMKKQGFRMILDGVFHHVGRNFAPFQDVMKHKEHSKYKDWFFNLRFDQDNPFGDGFDYDTWEGHYDLVKLNHCHPEVQEMIFSVISFWAETGLIHGLRLDAADVLPEEFRKVLSRRIRDSYPDFWLLGEVIHGDYRQWAHDEGFHSTTNYELYKGLWSSFNDKNFFEIAYSLNRQYGCQGIYRSLDLLNFADNHDVNRVSSTLRNPNHLFPLYGLLFTLPGIPSLYYGSELGLKGEKAMDDWPLRPDYRWRDNPSLSQDLLSWIEKLGILRAQESVLWEGDFKLLENDHTLLGFLRTFGDQSLAIWVNGDEGARKIDLGQHGSMVWTDCFSNEKRTGSVEIPPFGTVILRSQP